MALDLVFVVSSHTALLCCFNRWTVHSVNWAKIHIRVHNAMQDAPHDATLYRQATAATKEVLKIVEGETRLFVEIAFGCGLLVGMLFFLFVR